MPFQPIHFVDGAPPALSADNLNSIMAMLQELFQTPPSGDGQDGREIELSTSATHIRWRYVGTSTWTNLVTLESLRGPQGIPGVGTPGTPGTDGTDGAPGADGEDGTEIELSTSATHVVWRYVGDATWNNLVALSALKGDAGAKGDKGDTGNTGNAGSPGTNGREIELSTNATHVLWRYVGTTSWTNLIALSALKGDAGTKGDTGNTGSPGTNGREIELSVNATHVLWRYVGAASWTNLIALSAITGPKGDKGDQGDQGGQGIQGIQGLQGNPGTPGTNGREVEFNKSATHIQWRYVGTSSWTDLVPLSDLQGPAGEDGAPGAPGGGGSALPSYGAGSRTFDVLTNSYNLKPSNTRRWRAARNRAGRTDYATLPQTCNELWIGDSVVGGCTGLTAGAGGTARFDRLNTIADFAARAGARLSETVVPGTGLVRWRDNTRDDTRIAYSFTPGAVSSLPLNAGQWAEFTSNMAGSQVTIVFYDNFASSTTGFNVSVNGATSGAGFLAVTGTNTLRWRHVTLPVGVAVGGKVRITGVSGTTQHGFVEVKNIQAGGVQQHNIATSGSKVVGDWESTGSGFSKVRQITDAGALPWVADVVHLVFPYFDVNDNQGNPAPFKASMQTLINLFKNNSDVVLHCPPLPGRYRGTGGDPTASYMPYLTALYELADSNDLPLLDMHHLTGGYPVLQPMGLAGDDATHWLQPVYAMWGRATAGMV